MKNDKDNFLRLIPFTVNLFMVLFAAGILYFGAPGPLNELEPYTVFYFGFYELTMTVFIGYMGLICHRLKHCLYNWLAVVSLGFQNVLNLVAIFFSMDFTIYNSTYSQGLVAVTTGLSVIFIIKKI